MPYITTTGMRAPRLLVGANRQFEMMTDQFFAYDSSITVPLGRKPVWPYTLHYLMPHKCSGNHQGRQSKRERCVKCSRTLRRRAMAESVAMGLYWGQAGLEMKQNSAEINHQTKSSIHLGREWVPAMPVSPRLSV